MKRLLVILFLLSMFLFHSHADEKKKYVPWYLASPSNYNYSTYPPDIFDPNYLDKHNRWQEYFNTFIYRPQRSAIVVQRPPSFLESFLYGLGKGISKSVDYYYKEKQQEKYIEGMVKLLELQYDKKPKSKSGWVDRYDPLTKKKDIRMSEEERRANWERIKELDRIIEQKKKKKNNE